ncbi:hypothetical protein SISSUDRAFT_562552 [Sistotremastrum suecicum HHB10207 ss-3]|uniref:Uncharacterized protein n=1 Tax=Sistotremastrum suecicum HHB10207 ss-3 TaxID=1314776 RepID=A0A166ET05_9AGAM|nr:hypothetical protein SISSUDRAFT_562552 [Sistotremastrum suecicum HHB10207 ss-3]
MSDSLRLPKKTCFLDLRATFFWLVCHRHVSHASCDFAVWLCMQRCMHGSLATISPQPGPSHLCTQMHMRGTHPFLRDCVPLFNSSGVSSVCGFFVRTGPDVRAPTGGSECPNCVLDVLAL